VEIFEINFIEIIDFNLPQYYIQIFVPAVFLRQSRIRGSSGLIELYDNIVCVYRLPMPHPGMAQTLPSPGLGTTHAPLHSLIIGWKSPDSFLWANVGLKSTWRREACSVCLQIPPVPTMHPFVFPFPNFFFFCSTGA
jgi:hypothetical protein